MKNKYFTSILFLALILVATTIHAQQLDDSTKIKNIIQEEIVSWNKGDAETYSNHFANGGTFTNILGMFFIGHNEFQSKHAQVFKTVFKGTKLEQKIISLNFIHPTVAIVETLCILSEFSKNGPLKGTFLDNKGRLLTRLLQVMKKDKKDWKIVTYHNVDIKPGIPVPELL